MPQAATITLNSRTGLIHTSGSGWSKHAHYLAADRRTPLAMFWTTG
jgi:hypothetical protein